jgi:hypothetical protein
MDMTGGFADRRPLRRKRSFAKQGHGAFTGSYGVRHGFVAAPEQPRVGAQNLRSFKRVPGSFELRVGGVWRRVAGDVSGGGVLFLFPEPLEGEQVEVRIQPAKASDAFHAIGQIIGRERRGERYAHHVRFLQVNQGELVAALEQSIDPAGRLSTR